MTDRRKVILGATAIFAAIGSAQVHLHELAHAVTAFALGFHPILLYPTAIAHGAGTPTNELLVAAAGPLTSLLMAVVGFVLYRRWRHAQSAARLALVWLVYHGVAGSFGYLIVTPFSGDTHVIAVMAGAPRLAQWIAAAAGLYAMMRVPALLLPALADVAPARDDLATPQSRARWISDVAIVPWVVFLLGGLVTGWQPASVVGFAAFGIPLFVARSDAKKRDDLNAGERAFAAGTVVGVCWALFAVLLLLDALVLKHGHTLVP